MERNYNCFIFCGGKCGSHTLLYTMKERGFNCFHVHNNHNYQDRFQNIINKTGCQDVLSFIKYQKSKKIYIIDSYRDPIERTISSFFNNIEFHIGKDYLSVDMEILIIKFNEIFRNKIENYHLCIIEVEYDFFKKYYIKEIDNLVFIKLRFKDINEWSDILSSIFNKQIKLVNENISENKEYFDLYNKFKKKYKVPIDILNEVIQEKTFKKYNTPEEQEMYYEMWKSKSF
uniref:Sulfotransferase domain-containing protein n=1 Tax=viral metagenome TaxID=1070528 RepID=A0A6C0AEW8_9ZZZZ